MFCMKFNALGSFFSFNPFPHIDAFWHLWSRRLLKTMWQKKKLLKTSNFSFSHPYLWKIVMFLSKYWSRLLQICCMWESVIPLFSPTYIKSAADDFEEKSLISLYPLPMYRRFLTPLQQTTLVNTDKRRNCSKQAISSFATMFSTLFRN